MRITRRQAFTVLAGTPALLLPRKSAAEDTLPAIDKGPFEGSAVDLCLQNMTQAEQVTVPNAPASEKAAKSIGPSKTRDGLKHIGG